MIRAGFAAAFAALLLTACQTAPHAARATDTFWQVNGASPAERFELAKRSEPELIAFLRRMPKGADLHNHLGGATHPDYLLDSAREAGLRFDLEAQRFTRTDGDGTVSIDELEASEALLGAYRDAITMRGWLHGGVSGRDHFFQTFSRISSAGRSQEAMIAEVLERNRYQNVGYLELMAAPLPAAAVLRFAGAFEGLDLDDLEGSFAPLAALVDDATVHAAIRAEVDARESRVGERLGVPLHEHPVTLRYVLSLDRTGELERFFVGAVLFVTAIRADERFVAINIVAPEDAPAARRQFDAQMRILAFLQQQLGPVNMTLHAGELSLNESPVEPMQDRIQRTIDAAGARRIGHGVSVAWERDVVGLLGAMRRDGILVEVNLSSNEGILGIAGDRHPFQLYRAAGVPMCITTDDEAINLSNLTLEYVKAVQRYDLDYASVQTLVRHCLEYAFAGGESLYQNGDYARVRPEFAGVRRADWTPDDAARTLMGRHPRLALQVRLERDFVAFERALDTGFRENADRR